MKVQLGDSGQIVQLAQIGLEVFRELKKAGTLDEIGKELAEIHSAVSKHCAKLDVEKLRYYEKEGGLSTEQALRLLEVNKIAAREMFNSGWKGKNS